MNNIDLTIRVPELWGDNTFTKKEWGHINLLVGANGTGKSLFAEQLKTQLVSKGFKVRTLSAERLSGFEKQNYTYFTSSHFDNGLNISQFNSFKSHGEQYGLSTSAFVILKERLDIKIKIEAFLSDIFNKTIRLVEEGGFLKPKIQNIKKGGEYELRGKECHGLKELITILIFLYDTSNNCLIIDEPELHLHPQFQSFLLNEIRKIAGNPLNDSQKKLFFLITHSPYFIDLKIIDDLKSIVVFQQNKLPSSLTELDNQDEYIIRKFLPRFNTHHKQFFFSQNPVFVEGYTDQQIFTLLFERIEKNIGANGSTIIDVGGKDELGVFYKLCKKLKMAPIIISDVDALFKGRLREVLCENEKSNNYIQINGIGENISSEIGDLETRLKLIADELITKTSKDSDLDNLITNLKTHKNGDNIDSYRYATLLGIIRLKDKIESILSEDKRPILNLIVGRLHQLFQAARECNIHFLELGELEHYYLQTPIDYLNITNKDKAFHTERDFILEQNKDTIKEKYSSLIALLSQIIPTIEVNLDEHLRYEIIELIQKIQSAVTRGEIINAEELENNGRINYKLFNQIVTLEEFIYKEETKGFTCRIRLNDNKVIEINENTTASSFNIN